MYRFYKLLNVFYISNPITGKPIQQHILINVWKRVSMFRFNMFLNRFVYVCKLVHLTKSIICFYE